MTVPAAPEERLPGLADVLPAAARALGVPLEGLEPALTLDPHARVVVVLVDGLGDTLLAARGGHAPFLRTLRGDAASLRLEAAFPSTTATSLATLGTGLPPGAHGLVGLAVRDPETGTVVNLLSWDGGGDPERWQPHPTVFERVASAGIPVTRIGPGYFDGSGLSRAIQRGGRFVAAEALDARVDAAVAAVRASTRALVYLYWGDVDKVGHVHGCDSLQWADALTLVDSALARLASRLPPDTLLLVTADHGMVDVPFEARIDLAEDRELAAGVAAVGGEPRALHLYTETGAATDVAATWRQRLGSAAEVASREEAVSAGWFGPVESRVLPRIGDVVAVVTGPAAVVDSRVMRPEVLRLLGLHGSRTEAETAVPLLVGHGTARR